MVCINLCNTDTFIELILVVVIEKSNTAVKKIVTSTFEDLSSLRDINYYFIEVEGTNRSLVRAQG